MDLFVKKCGFFIRIKKKRSNIEFDKFDPCFQQQLGS